MNSRDLIPVAILLLMQFGCRAPSPRIREAIAPPRVPVRWREIGRSTEGRIIRCAEFGYGRSVTVVFGGYHGDEPASAGLALRLAEYLNGEESDLGDRLVVIVPEVNPDGLYQKTRKNARGVDLNRNLPATNWRRSKPRSHNYGGPYPGSEPETRAVIKLLQRYRPSKVVTIHQSRRGPMIDYNGPAAELAAEMARGNHYRAGMFFGNMPGSLGSYVGMDQNIPIITLELARGVTPEEAWEQNREALLTAIDF